MKGKKMTVSCMFLDNLCNTSCIKSLTIQLEFKAL